MSRRSRHRRDDFGGGENWFSSLLKPFRRFFSKVGGRDRSLERAASSEPLWKSLLLLVPRLLYELFRFLIFDWSTSRKGKAFLYALPALGTVALAIAMCHTPGRAILPVLSPAHCPDPDARHC